MDPRPIIKLRWRIGESHDRCTVFVGMSGQTLANCGELTFRHREESARFRSTLKMGIMPPGFEGIIESGWPKETESKMRNSHQGRPSGVSKKGKS